MKPTDVITFEPHIGGKGFKSYTATKSGNFSLSVIAGEYYYSTPRTDLDDVNDYTKFELAIFSKEGTWATYLQLKEAGAFDIIGDTGEYSEESESNINVFGWVDVAIIAELIEKL
jgi:hypothetical protein